MIYLFLVLIILSLDFNTFKYHVYAPMERFQLELIYLYFPLSFHLDFNVQIVMINLLVMSCRTDNWCPEALFTVPILQP